MDEEQLKSELEKLQNTKVDDLDFDYQKLNKLRFKYEFYQMQLSGLQMIKNINTMIKQDEIEKEESNKESSDN